MFFKNPNQEKPISAKEYFNSIEERVFVCDISTLQLDTSGNAKLHSHIFFNKISDNEIHVIDLKKYFNPQNHDLKKYYDYESKEYKDSTLCKITFDEKNDELEVIQNNGYKADGSRDEPLLDKEDTMVFIERYITLVKTSHEGLQEDFDENSKKPHKKCLMM